MLRQWLAENVRPYSENSIAYRFRKNRMKVFTDFYRNQVLTTSLPGEKQTILDVGGEFLYWHLMEFQYADATCFTLLNLKQVEIPASSPNFVSVVGDATNLTQYEDQSFDLVFSNSVIEHVGDFEAQRKMAQEMMRVGKHFYLQTPNKYFFLEPHFFVPFFQFMPLYLRAFLLKNFRLNFGTREKAKTYKSALACVRSVRLMTKRELKQLFPGVPIHKEKLGFLTKSFYLYF